MEDGCNDGQVIGVEAAGHVEAKVGDRRSGQRGSECDLSGEMVDGGVSSEPVPAIWVPSGESSRTDAHSDSFAIAPEALPKLS